MSKEANVVMPRIVILLSLVEWVATFAGVIVAFATHLPYLGIGVIVAPRIASGAIMYLRGRRDAKNAREGRCSGCGEKLSVHLCERSMPAVVLGGDDCLAVMRALDNIRSGVPEAAIGAELVARDVLGKPYMQKTIADLVQWEARIDGWRKERDRPGASA